MTKQLKNKPNNEIDAAEILAEHIRVFDTIDMLCIGINKKIDEINEEHGKDNSFWVPLAVLERLTSYIKKECHNSIESLVTFAETGEYKPARS